MKYIKRIVTTVITLFIAFSSIAQTQPDTLYIYGPGGPFGPINECAIFFSKQHKMPVKVTAGPEANWINDAQKNADIIFGGAEYMLTQFGLKHPGLVDSSTRIELYKRGAAILVRPGNPKRITGMKDLTNPGIHILDINGAGQFGLWEDIAGKENLIAGIQKNISKSFENTALGIAAWKTDRSYDAWISYSSWHYRLKDITQIIKLPAPINVYRGTPIAITTISRHKEPAKLFIQFILSKEGQDVFKKWGWE